MSDEIDSIKKILAIENKTYYACGKTFEHKEEFKNWGWHWNTHLKRWEIETYPEDEALTRFRDLYKEFGLWIKHD